MSVESPHIRMRDVARVYNALEVGVIITNGKGIIIWGNKYYSELAKFDIRNYFGRDVREISQREDVHLVSDRTMVDIILETKEPLTEVVRYRTEDYVITTATPIFSEEGEIDFLIYTITNYSELMRLQEKHSQSLAHTLALESHLRNIQLSQRIGKNIIIGDQKMHNLYGKALRLASTNASVMLTGESGVGKDVLARFIHQNGPRKDNNFIHVNLAAIPKALFESELFGYAEGAFTGASRHGKEGLIQLADHGTLFLDEIGELSLEIQAKLLQVLQTQEVRAIGATEPRKVDFRIICATNRDLKQMVSEHEFRLDLYYRLNTIELEVPPLRERRDDIPLLAMYFLNQYNQQNNSQKYLSSEVIKQFYQYPWPGNVRELQHVMESLVAICPSNSITVSDLPLELKKASRDGGSREWSHFSQLMQGNDLNLKHSVEMLEKHMIQEALDRSATAALAAELLGIDPSTLSKKRKRYGI